MFSGWESRMKSYLSKICIQKSLHTFGCGDTWLWRYLEWYKWWSTLGAKAELKALRCNMTQSYWIRCPAGPRGNGGRGPGALRGRTSTQLYSAVHTPVSSTFYWNASRWVQFRVDQTGPTIGTKSFRFHWVYQGCIFVFVFVSVLVSLSCLFVIQRCLLGN